MEEDLHTPTFDAPAPQLTPGVVAMQTRVSQRLFGIGTPQRLGRYTIERRLGAGGMGVVYAAYDAELSRQVAIKLVRTAQASAREQDRLREEARALAQLSHPNVVQIHEVGIHEGQLYLVMEYVEGPTLDRWAKDRSVREILQCCVQAGRGIAAAHAAGLLHRDVKPNNIIVGTDGRVRVIDFGLAAASPATTPNDSDSHGEQTSRLAGTPAYLAPEIYTGEPASPSSDQFGLCVTIWEALSGRRPFSSEQLMAVADGHALHPVGRVRPRWLQRVLLRGLASAPERRWPTMTALLHQLESGSRRRALGATFVAVTMITSLAVARSLVSAEQVCPDPAPMFAEVWNDERSEALARQLETRPGGEAEFTIVARVVDAHRHAWLETHTTACTATRVERTRTEAQLEHVLACLERDRSRLDSMLELFERPPGELDPRRLLLELGDPRSCEQSSFGQITPPPELAEQVRELRSQLDEITLLRAVAPRPADIASRQLVSAARELGFMPLVAEALALDGRIATQLGERERAQASLREAARLAKSTGDLRLEFRCLRGLVAVVTEQLEEPARGADLLALMQGSFEQLGRPEDLRAEALVAESELARLNEELGAAETLLRRALDRRRADLDEDDLRIEQIELDLANVVAEQGRLDEAITLYTGILDRLRRVLGPRHPELANVHLDLAITLLEQGESTLAMAHAEAALEIGREVYGGDSVNLAPLLVVLAQTQAGEGDVEGALASTREAWPLERRLPSDSGERGNALKLEAALLVVLERYDDALEIHERIEAELGPGLASTDRIALEQSIGWLLCRVHACRGARPRFEAVLAGGDEQISLLAQLGLAELELHENQVERAQARLESIVPRLERLPDSVGKDAALAEADFLLLRCALARHAGAAELRELAERVRARAPLASYIESMLDEVEHEATR